MLNDVNTQIKKVVTVSGVATPFVYGPCAPSDMIDDAEFLELIQEAMPNLRNVRKLDWVDTVEDGIFVKRAALTPRAQSKGSK